MIKKIEVENVCLGEEYLKGILLTLLNEDDKYIRLIQTLAEQQMTGEDSIGNE